MNSAPWYNFTKAVGCRIVEAIYHGLSREMQEEEIVTWNHGAKHDKIKEKLALVMSLQILLLIRNTC